LKKRQGVSIENLIKIENISNFVDGKNLNAESIYRPNYEQNDIPFENRLNFDQDMTV